MASLRDIIQINDIIQIIGHQGHNSDLIMEVTRPQSGTQLRLMEVNGPQSETSFISNNRSQGASNRDII